MPERIKLSRSKGWRMPPNTVKVARPSKWGNPVRVGDDLSYFLVGITAATADDAVRLFRVLMEAHEAADPLQFEAFVAPLRGKNLACWCPLDQPCHADVLLEIANRPNRTLSDARTMQTQQSGIALKNKDELVPPERFELPTL